MNQKYKIGDTVSFRFSSINKIIFGFIKKIDSLNDFHDYTMNNFYEISTSNGKLLSEDRICGPAKILLIEKIWK